MTRPRIAYIVPRFPTASETFVVRELNALVDEQGFDVRLLSLVRPRDEFLHPEAERWMDALYRPSPLDAAKALGWWLLRRPVRTVGLFTRVALGSWRRPGIMLRSLATLPLAAAHARVIRADRIAHVHAHFAAYAALAAWACGRLCRVTYSFTAHAWDIFVSQELLAMKVGDAKFVVTISAFNRRFLGRYGERARIEVVRCGVDPDLYRFRRRTPGANPRLLCVASLEEKKGHRVLLQAMATTPELAGATLDIVGGGSLLEDLRREVDQLALTDRVTFRGARAEEEVREFLDRADVLVLASVITADRDMEGIPVALIEGLACGLPVVASRISGIPELVTEGITGALATPGDARDLGAAIVRVIAGEALDPDSGRMLVETEFNIHLSAARLAELFTAALG